MRRHEDAWAPFAGVTIKYDGSMAVVRERGMRLGVCRDDPASKKNLMMRVGPGIDWSGIEAPSTRFNSIKIKEKEKETEEKFKINSRLL